MTQKKNTLPLLLQVGMTGLMLIFLITDTSAQLPSAFDLFKSDSVMHIRLTTDLKLLVKQKDEEIYQPATIEIQRLGDTIIHEVQIRARGNIRKEVCYYPPIRIKFSGDDYSHNKIKWVNACRDTEAYDQMLLKEYMAYRIFSSLTHKSFQTYLLQVEYVDSGRDNESFLQHAFVIEPEDHLAERLGGRVHEPRFLKEDYMDLEQLALFSMFEYMIANTDWAFANRHNMEIVTSPETNTLLTIPYDFDYSGFVHPPYAVPHETVPIDDVSERHNKSYCMTEEMCDFTRNYMLERKDTVLAACQAVPHLTKRTTNFTMSFVEDFFKIIQSERSARRIFVRDCNQMD